MNLNNYKFMKKNLSDLWGEVRLHPAKLFLVMKLTLFLIVLSVFTTTAKSYSQNLGLKYNNTSILQIFNDIEEKSEYTFVYSNDDLDVEKKVDLAVTDASIQEILDIILEDTGMSYEILNNLIILKKGGEGTLKKDDQDKKYTTGKVTDTSGLPLPGVSVIIAGTTNGTVTDFDGNYTITGLPDDAKLLFSFVGMKSQEVLTEGKSIINIVMEEESIGLDEVVAIGYGTQKKVNITGAVDVISNEMLENRQAPTVTQALQGQMPGVDFSIGDNGFQPGASMSLDIRGVGSINGGSPYVLIDGIAGSLDRLDPNDIESISVLKDAAASAIYGARAPYGVILVTTKSGKKGQALTVSYSGNVSVRSASRVPETLDSYTFARVTNEMGDNGGGRLYGNDDVDRIIAYQNGDEAYLSQFFDDDVLYYESLPSSSGVWATKATGFANYDWYDEWYGSSLNQQHNVSISGGEEKTSYYISGGMIDQNGILNYGIDNYKRYNLSAKINTALTDWWDVRYETRFANMERKHSILKSDWDYHWIFRQIARIYPTDAKYGGFGQYSRQSQIGWYAEAGGYNEKLTNVNQHSISTEIRPLKGWKIYGDFAYKTTNYRQTIVQKTWYEQLADKTYQAFANTNPSSIERELDKTSYWTTNIYSSYDFTVNKHSFLVLAGMQAEYNQSTLLNAYKTNLISQEVESLEVAIGDPEVGEDLTHWSTEGFFGRINYNYDEKYLLEANMRYDGSSVFKEGSRWGFFPSFSLGWNVNRENFWESISPYVNSFKIRGSWGQLGNQQVAAYQDLALVALQSGKLDWLFDYGSGRTSGYTTIPSLVSSDLTWETATTKNLGFNLAFVNNKLQVDLDVFERVTENMIGPAASLPGVLGASSPNSNNASLSTKGWELVFKWKDNIKNSGISYYATFNLSDAKTKIKDYKNSSGLITDYYPGKELGEIWGYTANSLFQTQEELDNYLGEVDLSYIYGSWNTGDVKYEDINNDGKVDKGAQTLSDHGDLKVIGNTTPRYKWGLSAGLNYKNFDFSFLIRGVAKCDYSFGPDASNENYRFWGVKQALFIALQEDHLDYFRDTPGDSYAGLYEGDANINLDAYWARPYMNQYQNAKNRQHSTRYLVNASYVRLQNVQLGYNLPENLLNKIHLKNLRLYVSGENLFTITDFLNGFDPAALGNSSRLGMTYGADKVFSLGINAKF